MLSWLVAPFARSTVSRARPSAQGGLPERRRSRVLRFATPVPEESPSWLPLTLPAPAALRAAGEGPRRPQPDRHPEEVVRLAGRYRVRRAARDDRRHLADRGLHRQPRRPVRRVHFDEPVASLEECREKDLTYARPLTVTVGFINRETGEIREQSVFMGDFPWMTERGTFVINGTERVVVTQLVRSPGAYLMEPKDPEKQVFVGNLMPARGSWLELEIDKKGRVYVRIDRKRKLPVTVLLRAMGYAPTRRSSSSSTTRSTSATRSRPTPTSRAGRGRADRAVQEAAPGRAAERRERALAAPPALLRPQALRPHARRPLQAQLAPRPRHRPRHARAHARRHHRPRQGARRAPERARHVRGGRRHQTTRPRRSRCRASRSPTASTSTSTSATAACARSAS